MKKTLDGRQIVAPTQAPDGWRTFLTGASDDPKNPSGVNGSGQPILLKFNEPKTDETEISLAAPIFLHNGWLIREGQWSVEDRFSLFVQMPATKFDVDGAKDVTFVEIVPGSGIGIWIPAIPGTGTHEFDQKKAIPVPYNPIIQGAGKWNLDEETSDVLPIFGGNGPVMLISDDVISYFAKNIDLGSDFYSDADQSEWVSQKWKLKLQVTRSSQGSASIAGRLFTYRRSTT